MHINVRQRKEERKELTKAECRHRWGEEEKEEDEEEVVVAEEEEEKKNEKKKEKEKEEEDVEEAEWYHVTAGHGFEWCGGTSWRRFEWKSRRIIFQRRREYREGI